MPVGDAVQTRPTLEQEIEKFKGFTTENGEVANGEETEDEKTSREARESADATAALAAKGGELAEETEEAKTAREAAEAEAAAAKKDGAAKPQKKTADERIAEITRARRASERELATERAARAADKASFEQRIAALERGEKSGLTPQRSAATDAAPDPKKFQYGELDAEYIRALARYETRQELDTAAKETKDTQQRDAAAREAREVAKQADAFIAKGAAVHDDFEEVVFEGARNGEWLLSDSLGKMLLTSEAGVALAYHLATHPNEAEELFGKTPLEQAAWLGRQEAKLSSASPGAAAGKTPAAKVTKAPIPPKDTAKGAGGNSGASESTNDFKAFERMANGAVT